MVVQDRTRPTGEAICLDGSFDGVCEGIAVVLLEPQDWVGEEVLCTFIECAKLLQRWLRILSSEVNFRKIRELGRDGPEGIASARIIGQPVSVTGQDQVVRKDHATHSQ